MAQADAVTAAQERTGEVWGKADRGSDFPTVDAWVGHLPAGRTGVEFKTDAPPVDGSPPEKAKWRGGHAGVRVEVEHGTEFAKISVEILKVRYSERAG